ncbi:predicted metal-sulfur cluster biosynthetic enzyme [Candidatus Vecturithrix granuli]|uniref:Predicted metal-sulfur cluster biosynthetic enzyme n=1 Tax=Vecturithrix granuli TaxID=1499967 RepID=A0A081C9T1_VECG1|nr:predicted metal-sulfur cluster biosynthetic enzyme [Candidatus Vecturithrix granuli]
MVTQEQVVEALRTVKDPETEMNIVELFLVNDVQIEEEGKRIVVDMGFQRKNPDCKACVTLAWYIQGKIIKKIEQVVGQLPGVETVDVLSN